jgi:hypothetical protein
MESPFSSSSINTSSASSRQLEGQVSDDRRGKIFEDARRRALLTRESIRESRQSMKALRQDSRRSIIEAREIRYGMQEQLLVFDDNNNNSPLSSEHYSSLSSEIAYDEEESL